MKAGLSARLACLAIFALLVGGCGAGPTIVVNDTEVYEKYWKQTLQDLTARAAFELDCPEASLEFFLLERQGRLPTEVGVVGCNRRSLYTLVGHVWFGERLRAEAGIYRAELARQAQLQAMRAARDAHLRETMARQEAQRQAREARQREFWQQRYGYPTSRSYTPSYYPSYRPSHSPSYSPSYRPSHSPSYSPSYRPSYSPSYHR